MFDVNSSKHVINNNQSTKNSSDKMHKILSITGGGVRGIFPSYILEKMKSQLNIDIYNYFDVFLGTSIGSLVAAAAALNLFNENNINVFLHFKKVSKKFFPYGKSTIIKVIKFLLTGSIYSSKNYKKLLYETFKDKKFKDIKKGKILIIPTTDYANGKPIIISNIDKKFNNMLIREAVYNSSCAPIFFKNKNNNYIDGGMWANNPILLINYLKTLNINFKISKLLSLGTFTSVYNDNFKPTDWRSIKRIRQLIYIFITTKGHFYNEIFSTMFEKDNYLSINPVTNVKLFVDFIVKKGFLNDFEKQYLKYKSQILNFIKK